MPASRAQRAQTAQRRARAVAMRIAGVRLDDIVGQLGYSSRAAASKDISRALAASLDQQKVTADELRALELARLDRLQAGLWPQAAGGDWRCAETVLKVIDRRVDLLRLKQTGKGSDGARSILGDLAAGLQLAYDALEAQDADDGGAPPD